MPQDQKEREFPPQQQPRPGQEGAMEPEPHDEMRGYRFAANQLSSYYTGEVLAPIGGETLPG